MLILSLIICNDAITVQQSPCQIQSFYAREIGSGEGNLLRVHLDTAGIPTNVSISGSCDSTKIKFSSKLYIFLVVGGQWLSLGPDSLLKLRIGHNVCKISY